MSHPWINRKSANKIHESVLEQKEGVQVIYIKAPAGAGKTFLARDLGTRLGSGTGYEPGRNENICWSGILDLYDPDTNNNRGIEKLLMHAFSSDPETEFREYNNERKTYMDMSMGGAGGGTIEDQRLAVQKAFSAKLRQMAKEKYLVLAFDTVERLQSTLDPTELKLGEMEIEDTASVMGWLMFQIARLPRATILLFGREANRLEERLKNEIREANYDREKTIGSIRFEIVDLTLLSGDEIEEFYSFRMQGNPSLKKMLTGDLKALLAEKTLGNPLLLDIALQTIAETGKINDVRNALDKKGDIGDVGKILVRTYMGQGTPERKTMLGHLALARNGLFNELLMVLEPEDYSRLLIEMERMAKLPFVKTRQVFAKTAEGRPTYFLHDAMYVICDEVILKPVETRSNCERIVRWYDQQIDTAQKRVSEHGKTQEGTSQRISGGRRDESIQDLLVESLFYRLRANPREGYDWYLRQSDYALRAVETGLEMRLRDGMAQFAVNANPDAISDSASSQIDRENIKNSIPDLWKYFEIDSATLWIKRLSFRGKHTEALKVADAATWVKRIYESNPKVFSLAYADFNIWKGQASMYLGKTQDAIELYRDNIHALDIYPLSELKKEREKYGEAAVWRKGLVKGRTYNNLGYTNWMYLGKYKAALRDLTQAVEYFKITDLAEEEANAKDNMGRIHALLWHQPSARLQIEDGLKKREEGRMTYRAALSRISLANMQVRFGHLQLALDNAKKALETFTSLEVQRGIGLALLTRSMIYRTRAEAWHERMMNIESAIKDVMDAISDLFRTLQIFQDSVQEKIRYVYALNEMGSCYRTLYHLRSLGKAPADEQKKAFDAGEDYYTRAIKEAATAQYFVEQLDSMQDLAVLYARARQYDNALVKLNEVRRHIPDIYQFEPNIGLNEPAESDTVDAFFKLMGQVELLNGALIFDRAKQEMTNAVVPSAIVIESMEHYVLAVAYYYRFSSVSPNTYIMATERIYKRLNQCDIDVVRQIKESHIPEWIKKYHIPDEWVTPLFNEIFEMLGI